MLPKLAAPVSSGACLTDLGNYAQAFARHGAWDDLVLAHLDQSCGWF